MMQKLLQRLNKRLRTKARSNKMKKSAFTILELLIVLFIVGMLTISGLSGFKHSRDSHRVDSLLQELAVLRTAILSYKEMHGKLPEIAESALTSDSFSTLKNFWYPFKPGNSKILEGGSWWGKIDANDANTFLAVKKDGEYVSFEVSILEKKYQNFCCYDATGTYFYILKP